MMDHEVKPSEYSGLDSRNTSPTVARAEISTLEVMEDAERGMIVEGTGGRPYEEGLR
jgi:hypothetical protein